MIPHPEGALLILGVPFVIALGLILLRFLHGGWSTETTVRLLGGSDKEIEQARKLDSNAHPEEVRRWES